MIYSPLVDKGVWRIRASSIRIGTAKNPIDLQPNGVDIGFDLSIGHLAAPREAFNVIVQQTGASEDPSTGLTTYIIKNCNNSFEQMDITVVLGNKDHVIPSKNYIVPYDDSDFRTCFINIIPIDQNYWIMGTPFLLQYYSVFDAEKSRIGFGDPKSLV